MALLRAHTAYFRRAFLEGGEISAPLPKGGVGKRLPISRVKFLVCRPRHGEGSPGAKLASPAASPHVTRAAF